MLKKGNIEDIVPELARQFPRAPFSAPVILKFNNQTHVGNCSVIGEGGCFVEMKNENIKEDNLVELQIISDVIHMEIIAKGQITSIVNSFPRGFGIKFLDLDEKYVKEINKFLERYIEFLKA